MARDVGVYRLDNLVGCGFVHAAGRAEIPHISIIFCCAVLLSCQLAPAVIAASADCYSGTLALSISAVHRFQASS